MRLSFWPTVRLYSMVFLVALGALSCEQFEYASPEPGIIEIRLAAVNNRQDLIPFAVADSFGFAPNTMFLNVRDLSITQPGDVELPIYADLNAIRRNDDGDPVNCLDTRARDSLLLIGKAYAPPGVFTGLELTVEPPPQLFISQGSYGSVIPILQVPGSDTFQQFPGNGGDLNILIQQGRVTRVVVTYDMDTSLIQRSERFDYIPSFYVSSVTNF